MKIKRAELLHIIAESIENAFQLPSYAEWKRNIEEEVMWYLYNGGKSRWKIGGNVFFDNSGHALYHLGPTLLCEVLKHVNLNMADEKGMIEQVVELGHPIGYQECVETNDSDNIVYLQRNGRKRQSRYAVGRSPDPCSTVFIVLRKIKKAQNVYQIITGYVGTKSGKEPWDRRATDSDAEFWRNHALVSPDEIDSSEDVGEEGYWTRIVAESIKNYFYKNMKKNTIKLNEAQLRKMITESVKKVLKEGVTDDRLHAVEQFDLAFDRFVGVLSNGDYLDKEKVENLLDSIGTDIHNLRMLFQAPGREGRGFGTDGMRAF